MLETLVEARQRLRDPVELCVVGAVHSRRPGRRFGRSSHLHDETHHRDVASDDGQDNRDEDAVVHHVLHYAARSQRPAKPRRIRPRCSSLPRPASAVRASSGVSASSPSVPWPSSIAASRRASGAASSGGDGGTGSSNDAAGRAGEQLERVGGVADQRCAGLDQRVGSDGQPARDLPGTAPTARPSSAAKSAVVSEPERSVAWTTRVAAPSAAMMRLRAMKHHL